MDKNELFKIFMKHGVDVVVAYYDGNLDQFLVSVEMGGDDLGDFEDDEFRDDGHIWKAVESISRTFDNEELRQLGNRLGYDDNCMDAYHYARFIIRGRWPEGEDSIKRDPLIAYSYARNIIKDRWPEAEDTIKQESGIWDKYQEFLNNG